MSESILSMFSFKSLIVSVLTFRSFFFFLGLHLWHMEVSGLGLEMELQLPVYNTATAMQDLSHLCNPCHSLWQHQIFNPLSEAWHQTCIFMDISLVLNPLSLNRNYTFRSLINHEFTFVYGVRECSNFIL